MNRRHAPRLIVVFIIIPSLLLPLPADGADVEALAAGLASGDSETRMAALEALGELDDPRAVELLIEALAIRPVVTDTGAPAGPGQGPSHAARREWFEFNKLVSETLGGMGEVAFEPLIAALAHEDMGVRSGAAKALGRLGDERAIEPLIAGLRHDERRNISYNSGARIGLQAFGNKAFEPLAAAVKKNDDPWIRANAATILGRMNAPGAIPLLIEALRDEAPVTRQHAAMALGMMRDRAALEPLLAMLDDPDDETRATACMALGWFRDGSTFDPLLHRLENDESARVRSNAAKSLGQLHNPAAFDPLLEVLKNDPDWTVRGAAAYALADTDRTRAAEPLLEALSLKNAPPPEDTGETRTLHEHLDGKGCEPVEVTREYSEWDREREHYLTSVAHALSNIGESGALEMMVEMLDDENPAVRRVAARVLGNLRDQRAVAPLLKAAAEDQDPQVNRNAVASLERLGHPRGGRTLQSVDAPEACTPPDQRSRRHTARALARREGGAEEIAGMLAGDDPEARAVALLALGMVGDSASMETIAGFLDNEDDAVRLCAVEALSKFPDPRLKLLVPMLGNRRESDEVRAAAARAIGEMGRRRPSFQLLMAAQEDDPALRSAALEALGRSGDRFSSRQLIEALGDEDAEVRAAAALSLGAAGDRHAVEPLLPLLEDPESKVRHNAQMALGQLQDPRAVEPLLKALDTASPEEGYQAINALGQIGDARAVEPLIGLLDDGWCRPFALRALCAIDDPRALDAVIAAFDDGGESAFGWDHAAVELSRLGPAAVEPLIGALGHDAPAIRLGAVRALGQIGDARAVAPLIAVLAADEDEEVRSAAASALGWIGDARAIGPLSEALGDPSAEIRRNAVLGLGALDDEQAIAPLADALENEDREVRTAAVLQLARQDAPGTAERLLPLLADGDDEIRKHAAMGLCHCSPDHPELAEAVRTAMDAGDLLIIAGAYALLVEEGDPDHLPLLEEALTAHGFPEMAQDLSLCGHEGLERAARAWAMANRSTTFSFDMTYCVLCPRWGSLQ